jgi:DNA repair protein RecO (recombination protein O)
MSIEKTKAFILKTLPYRESSGIFYLLTERQGVVHGIAKGIRKKKGGTCFPERGFLIEALVYSKPHRELHTLADVQMIDYYPRIRNDLIKGAVRDAAFEAILASVSTGFPSPELFSLMTDFCASLEERSGRLSLLLWHFYATFSRSMGFGIDSERCVICKKEFTDAGGVCLAVEKGGFACEQCASFGERETVLPATVLRFLAAQPMSGLPSYPGSLSREDERRITRLLASYCHYHSDTRSDCKALEFLDSLLFTCPGE